MRDAEYLKQKRLEVLNAIKPICEAFNITDYDYEICDTGQRETLRINNISIDCSCNSISAVVDELIGYLFIEYYCENRSLGAFETQVKNRITSTWMKGVGE